MFPNFTACLELNHSCNEERKERSRELCAHSQEKRRVPKHHRQQFQCTAHIWPSVDDESPDYLEVGLAVCVVPSPLTLFFPHTSFCWAIVTAAGHKDAIGRVAIKSISMLAIPVKTHHRTLWQKQDSLSALQLPFEKTPHISAPCSFIQT